MNTPRRRFNFQLVLPGLFLLFGLLACQLFGFELRKQSTPTPTTNLSATIALLVTANNQLAGQVATSESRLEQALQTPTPAPVVTVALPTIVSPATTPPTPIAPPVMVTPAPPPVRVRPTFTPTPPPTPTPAQWTVARIFFSPKMLGRLYALQTNPPNYRVLTSNNYGQNWATLITGWPVAPACINSFNLDYYNPELFFLSTCQGIYHWTTVGWKQEFTRPVGSVTNLPEEPNLLWATEPFGPTEVPVQTSFNSQTFTPASRYLEHTNGVATLMFDPVDPVRLFAVVWPEYPGSRLRRGAANGQWVNLPAPPTGNPVDLAITVDGLTGTLYATTGNSQLWRSPNPNTPNPENIHWDLVNSFDASQPITLLGASWPNNQLVLFANLNNAPHYSLDRGATWAALPVPRTP